MPPTAGVGTRGHPVVPPLPLIADNETQPVCLALLPSTRPGTRFTDGWAGGLAGILVMFSSCSGIRDSNQCPHGL